MCICNFDIIFVAFYSLLSSGGALSIDKYCPCYRINKITTPPVIWTVAIRKISRFITLSQTILSSVR